MEPTAITSDKHNVELLVKMTQTQQERVDARILRPGTLLTAINLKQGRRTLPRSDIEALHRRILSGHMVFPKAGVLAGGKANRRRCD